MKETINLKELFKTLLSFAKTDVPSVDPTATPAPAPATPALTNQASLQDGTVIAFDKLAKGGQIQLIQSDGSAVPLPAGSYILNDNSTTITVEKDGEIADVVAKTADEIAKEKITEEQAAAPNAPVADPNAPATPADDSADTKILNEIDQIKEILQTVVQALQNSVAMNKAYEKRLSAIEKQPAVAPIATKYTKQEPKKAVEQSVKTTKYEALIKNLKLENI